MNATAIESQFAAIGARFKLRLSVDRWESSDYAIDIRHDRQGEFFELRLEDRLRESFDASVLQADKRDRHLLLLVRRPQEKLDRFLCGHDERHWFVAAVPGLASSVVQAKEALKPRFVRNRLAELRVRSTRWNLRKNEAFKRQGEWFFVSVSRWGRERIDEKFALRNEPLRRGAGKPHIVEEIYRVGGEAVYVSHERPNGITEDQYRRLLWDNPRAAGWRWRVMRRNPRVYARGTVRHSDHATIILPDWHRVVLNTETETETMRNVAFID